MLSVPAGLGSASGALVGIIVGAGAGAVEVDLGVGVGSWSGGRRGTAGDDYREKQKPEE